MTTIHVAMSYAKKRPILVGATFVVATILVGAGVALAVGFGNPAMTHADDGFGDDIGSGSFDAGLGDQSFTGDDGSDFGDSFNGSGDADSNLSGYSLDGGDTDTDTNLGASSYGSDTGGSDLGSGQTDLGLGDNTTSLDSSGNTSLGGDTDTDTNLGNSSVSNTDTSDTGTDIGSDPVDVGLGDQSVSDLGTAPDTSTNESSVDTDTNLEPCCTTSLPTDIGSTPVDVGLGDQSVQDLGTAPDTSTSESDTDTDTNLEPCCEDTTQPVDTTVDTPPVVTPPVIIPPVVIPPVVTTPQPACTLTASPDSIQSGGSATLEWTTTNATFVSINHGIGTVDKNGSETVSPGSTITYTLTADGQGDAVINCTATVTVTTPPPPPAPTCTLVANPTTIQSGDASTLSWATNNAVSFSINHNIGSVTPVAGGSLTVSPTATITYVGTATSANGQTANCTAMITVNTPPPAAPTCTLTANPNTVQVGSPSVLSWTTTNAVSFAINNGVGSVTPVASGSTSVSPLLSTTYTGTATSASGQTVNCYANVHVTVLPPPASCTLSVNPTSINSGGSAILSWSTNNAVSFSIDNGVGSVTPVAGGSITIHPTNSTTYTGTATSANGQTVNCSATIVVNNQPPPAPTCTLTANPTSIELGNSSILAWTTTNASSFVIDHGVGSVTPVSGGSTTVTPLVTTTYTGTATNSSGQTVNCYAQIQVNVIPPPPAAPTCTLVANPNSITSGGSAILTWATTNASTFAIDQGIGTVTPVAGGSTSVSPTTSTTYTGTATSANGQTVNCTATVIVQNTPPPPQAPTCTLTASPSSIEIGGASALSWVTTNASSFVIDHGVGSVTPVSSGSTSVSPLLSTTYTGTATGSNGQTVNCSAAVTVTILPPPPAPTCTLVANPNSIQQGSSSILTWTTSNATSFSINNGVGSMTPVAGGSINVTPANSITYTGTATGSNGQTVNCQTQVVVTTPGGGPTPECILTASPMQITQGGTSVLSWGGSYITGVSISGIGNAGPSGSVTVNPAYTTTYTGVFTTTTGQTITCSATVNVVPQNIIYGGGGGGGGQFVSYIIPPPVQQVAAGYVSLSQIPYTGLDLGPVGTVIYWIALIVFCLAAAYLILFRLVPFIYHRLQKFGIDVGHVLNDSPQLAAAGHAAHGAHGAAHGGHGTTRTHTVVHSTAAPAPVAASTGYSSQEGFRSFAHGNTLTIDDIVKGLAREAGVVETAPVVAAYAAQAHAEEAARDTVVAMAPKREVAAVPAQQAPSQVIPTDVRDFIAALLQGDRNAVFSAVRQIVREGGDAEAFMTQVVCALDDAYRARIDGTSVHPEIARLTQSCATPFLERLTQALTNAVDSSYSPGISGAKLAVARALAVVEG